MAGDAGKFNVFFYGTTSRNFMDSKANWIVYMSQSQKCPGDGTDLLNRAGDAVRDLHGAICNGTGCPAGIRTLLEYFFPDTALDGNGEAVHPESNHTH